MAGRLVENGYEVLLIEAGGPANFLMGIPSVVAGFQMTAYDWQYKTEPQKHAPLRVFKSKYNNSRKSLERVMHNY